MNKINSKFQKKSILTLGSITFFIILGIGLFLEIFFFKKSNSIDLNNIFIFPNKSHLLGTDELGRDYLSRCLVGGGVSLVVGFSSMILSLFIGSILGYLTGYLTGGFETILMAFIDIFASIPWLISVTALSVILEPGVITLILIIGLFSWVGIARVIRGEVLQLKKKPYIEYARYRGTSQVKLFFSYFLPNLYPILLVTCTESVAGAILTESSLSFLGIGIHPPTSSWGNLLQNAQGNLQQHPHLAFIPGFLILLTVCCLNQFGKELGSYLNKESRGIKLHD